MEREAEAEAHRQPAKPTLLLVPPVLINQWIGEIKRIAPKQFRIYLYYGDGRKGRETMAGVQSISDVLDPKHPIFSGMEQNARTIVVSSYHTFADRNGPKAQKIWRRKHSRMPEWDAEARKLELDNRWPKGIAGCFGLLVADECHFLKSTDSNLSAAARWAAPDKFLGASATLLNNAGDDCKGYMPLIESYDAESWWSQEALTAMKVDENVNPYTLADNHPATKLRLTAKAAKEFLFRSSVSGIDQGLGLSMIFKEAMIRRTNESRIPFRTGAKVGDSMPGLKAVTINCNHTTDEKMDHKTIEAALLGSLAQDDGLADENQDTPKKIKYSLRTHRKLQLLSFSTNLAKLDDIYDLKAGNMRKLFESRNIHLDWLETLYPGSDFDMQDPYPDDPIDILNLLLDGAPKLRAWIKNVRDHVSSFPSVKDLNALLFAKCWRQRHWQALIRR